VRTLVSCKQHRYSAYRYISTVIVIVFCALNLSAQKPKENPLAPKTKGTTQEKPQTEAAAHELTPEDLQAFLDGMVPLQIAREDIAGVVISVVKDGKPFFAKGYGYSDVEKRIPVSPENTLFRPGSISKLFTWDIDHAAGRARKAGPEPRHQ
jgi:CubicO group peptidase (beta-lactamase class C family)